MIYRLALLLTFIFSSGVVASNESADINQPYAIKDTEILPVKSSVNGLEYDLYIKLPPSYDRSDKKYPILVLTDSTYAFPLVSSITHRLHYGQTSLEDIIIVGISYSKGDKVTLSRTRDYTPTHSPNETNGHSVEAKAVSGRADNFIEFISTDVFSTLEERYRVDMDKRVFAGHSFGGLLANYMLLTRPETFHTYLSGSPSLWYDDKVLFDIEVEFAQKNENLSAKLYMAIGDAEDGGGNKMVEDMRRFEEQIVSRNYSGLTVKTDILVDEDHETSYPNFITRGILWTFEHEN